MIFSLSSNVLLVSFPWRKLEFSSSPTHFSVRFDFSPISQTKLFSSINVAKEVEKDDSFTVSYLINSLGLSSEYAKLASKQVKVKDPSKADNVLNLFRNHGFSDAHLQKVVRSFPGVLVLNPEKILKPKMEFFLSIGVKAEDLVVLVSRNPNLLSSSLNEKIIPLYDFLKRVLVHDELVVKSFKSSSKVWRRNLETVVPNFELLKKVGVTESNFQLMLIHYSNFLAYDHAELSKRVNTVIEMGFDPSKTRFLEAIRSCPRKSTWEHRAQVCKSWGWADSDIWLAFRISPAFMTTSVEKLTAVMDILMNKMGWDPPAIASSSYVFTFSLKNIIPKCSVIRVLQLKGLVGKEITLSSSIPCAKKTFLDRFVFKYLKQAPELLDVFEGEVDLSELGFGFEEKLDTKLK